MTASFDREIAYSENLTTLQPGTVIASNYKVSALVGSGGMSDVYRVEQIYLGKEFALKLLSKHHHTAIAVRRFQQEARTTAQLKHPNLIDVHDFGVHADDQPYLVMEFVEGETLSALLKRSGSLPLDYVVALALELCEGLRFAHERGIVHRDIKPGNIMILNPDRSPSRGSVKILDFGIAKLSWGDHEESQELTKTGEIFGSPLYMSPEQCQGMKVDQRTDIYSLGCVLFECLTGTPPFIGENAMSSMLKRLTDAPPTLKEASLGKKFPAAIETILKKMLAGAPDQRYHDLAALSDDLERLRKNVEAERQPPAVAEVTGSKHSVSSKLLQRLALVTVTAILSCSAMALVDRNIIFAAEFSADQAYRAEKKRQSELEDKNSAEKVFVDYKEVLHYPTREFTVENGSRKEVLNFPSRCGTISFSLKSADISTDSGTGMPAIGKFYPEGRLTNLYLDEDAAADPEILKNLLDVNFGIVQFSSACRVSNDTLKLLGKLKHVKTIDIGGGDVSSLESILDLPLEGLDIAATRIASTDILRYKHLKDLQSITFGPVDDPTGVIKQLNPQKLTSFYYKGALAGDNEAKLWRELNDSDIQKIAEMPFLRSITFDNCTELTDKRLEQILPMQCLTALTIRDCNITPASLKTFRKMHISKLKIAVKGWPRNAVDELKKLPIKTKLIEEAREVKDSASRATYNEIVRSFDLEDPSLNQN